MKKRIVLTVLTIIIAFFAIQAVEQYLAPKHASDLAIEQVNNPDAMAQLRIEQNTQDKMYTVISVALAGSIIGIWWTPVRKLVNEEIDKNIN